jgi:methionyl-tRNA formyltransferase
MSSALKIVFAGTPQFAVPALQALTSSGHDIVAVYTQPDRPAGRGRHLSMSAVKQCALDSRLLVEQPDNLRDAASLQRLRELAADLMIVAAYGLLLPAEALSIPALGCINIHASLLPRWRGAAPIQRAILAGDRRTGIDIMRMEAGLDTGPVLLERSIAIDERDTAGSLHDRLAELGAQVLMEALPGIATGTLHARPQAAEGVTYAAKLRKEEARIDWSHSAIEIDRRVRAFNPWPVAETRWREQQLRVWHAVPTGQQSSAPPGTVIAVHEGGAEVSTGSGTLVLTRVQLAGRKPTAIAEFLRAHSFHGVVLG